MTDSLPYLDLADPGFSTRSAAVAEARRQSWCARTPYGLAVLRYGHAGRLLRDRRLRQGSHAWPDHCGLTGSFADFWTRSVIAQEGAPHKLLRRVAMEALANDHILSLTGAFAGLARDLVAALPRDRPFDFMEAFSEPFAGQAIGLLLGLDAADAPAMARDASTLGLAMGTAAKSHQPAVNTAADRLDALAAWLLDRAARGEDRGGFAARLHHAATRLEMNDDRALRDLVIISIFGGVDTTRAQLGFAMTLFAAHPRQWADLRADRALIGPAIEEVIRTRPTTTWSTRQALESFDIDGVRIAKGETLHILVHATGTDPDAGGAAGFDIHARRKAHFGFGGGAHHCLGQFVARTDMAAALGVLLDNWHMVRLGGTPDYLPDSGNTSPARLPLAPVWAD